MPLLAHFSDDELEVSLVDVHQEAIDSVKIVLEHLAFVPRVRQFLCADATVVAVDSPADLVLMETMNTALTQEPQVAISHALIQPHPSAVLLPESVRVDLALVDFASEASYFPPRGCERIKVARLFDRNRRTAIEPMTNGCLPAACVQLPEDVEPRFAPHLTTSIQVFDDMWTSDYETQITTPVPLQQPGHPPTYSNSPT